MKKCLIFLACIRNDIGNTNTSLAKIVIFNLLVY